MAWLATRAIAGKRNRIAIQQYRKCIRCSFHHRKFKRCGDGSGIIGCGCHVVYKIAAGGKCWGRENIPGFTEGF